MEPLRQYLAKQFARAAESWEFKEKAKLAKAAAGPGGRPQRKYRVVEVAGGEDDLWFAKQIEILGRSVELWAMVPPSFQRELHFWH